MWLHWRRQPVPRPPRQQRRRRQRLRSRWRTMSWWERDEHIIYALPNRHQPSQVHLPFIHLNTYCRCSPVSVATHCCCTNAADGYIRASERHSIQQQQQQHKPVFLMYDISWCSFSLDHFLMPFVFLFSFASPFFWSRGRVSVFIFCVCSITVYFYFENLFRLCLLFPLLLDPSPSLLPSCTYITTTWSILALSRNETRGP